MSEAFDKARENDDVRAWVSGSMAVVIPVEVERPLAGGGRRPGELGDDVSGRSQSRVWDLTGFRRSSRTDPLMSPGYAEGPISDPRITQTQNSMHYRLYKGKNNPAQVPATAAVGDRADWWDVKVVEVFAFDTPSDVFKGPFDLTSTRTHLIETPSERARRIAAGEKEPRYIEGETATGDASMDRFTAYVVLHVVLKPVALQAVREAVAYFSLPSSAEKQERYWPTRQLRELLGDLDLDGTVRWRRRPFVLTHLVPAGQVPKSADLLHGAAERGWTDEQVWAWRLANGPDLSYDNEPGWSAETPVHGGFWSGSTWCRVGHRGAAFIGTRPLDQLPTSSATEGQKPEIARKVQDVEQTQKAQYFEHARVEAFTHRNAVDLVILAFRQTRFLQQHATDLRKALAVGQTSSTPNESPSAGLGDADGDAIALADARASASQATHDARVGELDEALKLERRLIEFRNQLWLDHAPGEPDISATLAGLHEALGPNRLLSEIDAEQQDMTRILELTRQRAAAELEQARHALARAQQGAAQKQAADAKRRRDLLDQVVAFVGPLVAVPAVVLSFTQVYQGGSGSRPELWVAVLFTTLLCLISWGVLAALLPGPPPTERVKEACQWIAAVGRSTRPAGARGREAPQAETREDSADRAEESTTRDR